MQTIERTTRPPTALRIFDAFIWICMAAIAVLTVVVAIVVVGKSGFGGGDMHVQGWTDDVLIEHTTPDGRSLNQDLSGGEFAQRSHSSDARFLSANVQTQVEGFGPKLVLILAIVIDVALAWFALINVQRLTRSSMRGDVFTRENSKRIARLGWAALAFPVLSWWVGKSLFNSITSNESTGVSGFFADHGIGPSGSLFAWLGVGLLLHTIARAFQWGIELQELEAGTI